MLIKRVLIILNVVFFIKYKEGLELWSGFLKRYTKKEYLNNWEMI